MQRKIEKLLKHNTKNNVNSGLSLGCFCHFFICIRMAARLLSSGLVIKRSWARNLAGAEIFSASSCQTGGRIAQWITFLLCIQRPQVQFSALPRFIEHCLVSGQWHSNKPINYKAGVCISSWGIRQASTTKNVKLGNVALLGDKWSVSKIQAPEK